MGAETKIEWTDATVNFWWGCTKVGPGCDHCYAEAWSKRTGGNYWGPGVARRKIKSAVKTLHRLDNGYSWWAADHYIGSHHAAGRRRVFVQSMSDLFDLEVPLDWFAEAWQTIDACDRVDIQIVTKRISVVEKRLEAIGRNFWPRHAGLIISVVNQAEADRDVPRLLALKAKLGIPWVGLSMEPLLGPVDLRKITTRWGSIINALTGRMVASNHSGDVERARLDWVIVGGESGPNARPMHLDWARSLRDQCAAAGVPFFLKQWGEWLVGEPTTDPADGNPYGLPLRFADGHTFDVNSDGEDIMLCAALDEKAGPRRIWRDYHGWQGHLLRRVGKKAAGRLLDGVEHNAMPLAAHRAGSAAQPDAAASGAGLIGTGRGR